MVIRNVPETGKMLVGKAGILAGAMLCFGLFAATTTEMIKNGDFSSTVTTNWTLAVKDTSVKGAISGGQYVVTRAVQASAADSNSWGIQFSQKGLNIEKGKSYIAVFSAKADTDFIMTANVGMVAGPNPTYSGYKQFSITKVSDTFSYAFKMDSATDADARIVFDVGFMRAKGSVTLDNISLKLDTASVTPPASGELIKNGNFNSTVLSNWSLNIRSGSGATATMKVAGNVLEINITKMGSPDPLIYDIQLSQVGLNLVNGKDYKATWAAKSDSTYQFGAYVGMNKDPWGMYSSYNGGNIITPAWDSTYEYSFTMDSATDPNARIAFDVGDQASGGPRKVWFDNISLKCLNCNAEASDIALVRPQSSRLHAVLKTRSLEIAGISSPVSFCLYNSAGKVMFSRRAMTPENGTVSLKLNRKSAPGIYFVRITEKNAPQDRSSTTIRLINQ